MLSLQEILEQARQQAAAKAAVKKRKERPYILEAAERHQYDWDNIYQRETYVARFVHTCCTNCGSSQQSLMGIYEQRKHPRLSDRQTKRLSPDAIAMMDSSLPRSIHLDVEQVQACLYCTHRLGFATHTLPELIHAKTEVTSS